MRMGRDMVMKKNISSGLEKKWSGCRYRDGMNICKKKDAYVDSYAQIERHCKGCKETEE